MHGKALINEKLFEASVLAPMTNALPRQATTPVFVSGLSKKVAWKAFSPVLSLLFSINIS
jgi:hypothetical protein